MSKRVSIAVSGAAQSEDLEGEPSGGSGPTGGGEVGKAESIDPASGIAQSDYLDAGATRSGDGGTGKRESFAASGVAQSEDFEAAPSVDGGMGKRASVAASGVAYSEDFDEEQPSDVL